MALNDITPYVPFKSNETYEVSPYSDAASITDEPIASATTADIRVTTPVTAMYGPGLQIGSSVAGSFPARCWAQEREGRPSFDSVYSSPEGLSPSSKPMIGPHGSLRPEHPSINRFYPSKPGFWLPSETSYSPRSSISKPSARRQPQHHLSGQSIKSYSSETALRDSYAQAGTPYTANAYSRRPSNARIRSSRVNSISHHSITETTGISPQSESFRPLEHRISSLERKFDSLIPAIYTLVKSVDSLTDAFKNNGLVPKTYSAGLPPSHRASESTLQGAPTPQRTVFDINPFDRSPLGATRTGIVPEAPKKPSDTDVEVITPVKEVFKGRQQSIWESETESESDDSDNEESAPSSRPSPPVSPRASVGETVSVENNSWSSTISRENLHEESKTSAKPSGIRPPAVTVPKYVSPYTATTDFVPPASPPSTSAIPRRRKDSIYPSKGIMSKRGRSLTFSDSKPQTTPPLPLSKSLSASDLPPIGQPQVSSPSKVTFADEHEAINPPVVITSPDGHDDRTAYLPSQASPSTTSSPIESPKSHPFYDTYSPRSHSPAHSPARTSRIVKPALARKIYIAQTPPAVARKTSMPAPNELNPSPSHQPQRHPALPVHLPSFPLASPIRAPRAAWYFFYGSVQSPTVLADLLELPTKPVVLPAIVSGWRIKYFGPWPAAVSTSPVADGPEHVIRGSAWYVPSAQIAAALRKLDGGAFWEVGCEIEFVEEGLLEEGEKVDGRMFEWRGEASGLMDRPAI
ncbi:hypothetical protein BT63DRAFT_294743 [Microthyrium microscopicum]|uniref:Gamma-glutamylcyclotransferase AIG2-like domain-containing protein n=1 Tax=Microthyrium microscopicum TaxID=703497 RepID=A0A6A6U8W5_9PEZI|nr:hypothetical protein BT63DRAFT_294743 [Microthyrium microscopicum]